MSRGSALLLHLIFLAVWAGFWFFVIVAEICEGYFRFGLGKTTWMITRSDDPVEFWAILAVFAAVGAATTAYMLVRVVRLYRQQEPKPPRSQRR